MQENKLALVTGANGHLGNNLVRNLLNKNIPVRATVRNLKNTKPFEGLDVDLVQADIMDKASLQKAMQGVDVLYAVAANFKLWAKNPQQEIYDVNMQGTQNVIEAAAEAGVQKIVYVSSVAALNYAKRPINESNGYNTDRRDVYYNSKNDSEKLAFELARKYDINLTAIMPSAMIGSEAFLPLNTSYNILKLILNKKVPVDTGISVNWIDVKDVAEGAYLASVKGKNGERYILANPNATSITETIQLAKNLYPQLKLSIPKKVPKPILYGMATLMEAGAKLSGKPPVLTRKDLNMFVGLNQDFDISKAKNELGYNPKPPKQALTDAFNYLMQNPQLLK